MLIIINLYIYIYKPTMMNIKSSSLPSLYKILMYTTVIVFLVFYLLLFLYHSHDMYGEFMRINFVIDQLLYFMELVTHHHDFQNIGA